MKKCTQDEQIMRVVKWWKREQRKGNEGTKIELVQPCRPKEKKRFNVEKYFEVVTVKKWAKRNKTGCQNYQKQTTLSLIHILLLAIVVHDYCSRYISVGSNGRNADGGIFRD